MNHCFQQFGYGCKSFLTGLLAGILLLFSGVNFLYAQTPGSISNYPLNGNHTYAFGGGPEAVSGDTLPTAGLVAYYPFNGNADDASGNGNHGTTVMATLTTGSILQCQQRLRV